MNDQLSQDSQASAAGLLRAAVEALEQRHADEAAELLARVRKEVPEQAEVLRLSGIAALMSGATSDAVRWLRRACELNPRDPATHMTLGSALFEASEVEAGLASLREACRLAPGDAEAWFNLGTALAFEGLDNARLDALPEASSALRHAVELAPSHVRARNRLARILLSLGETIESIEVLRGTLSIQPDSIEAWVLLGGMKVERLGRADVRRLQRLLRRPEIAAEDRAMLQFTLAKGLEDVGDYQASFAELERANAAVHAMRAWDREQEQRRVDRIEQAFPGPQVDAADRGLGARIIFVVCVPRSGSTLVEQILASHPQVRGGGETGHLVDVLGDESDRRGKAFPDWVAEATPEDWQRLGQDYLGRLAAHGSGQAWFVDKSVDNWACVGAIMAMLPGAHIIDSRRDALETCFACYRQHFAVRTAFSYDLDAMVDYYAGYLRLADHWQRQYPQRYFVCVYEALQVDFEAQVRALLDFCGLPFDAACLEFHASRRAVLTMSSAQVREPISRDTARAARYGVALDPLRARLRRAGIAFRE